MKVKFFIKINKNNHKKKMNLKIFLIKNTIIKIFR